MQVSIFNLILREAYQRLVHCIFSTIYNHFDLFTYLARFLIWEKSAYICIFTAPLLTFQSLSTRDDFHRANNIVKDRRTSSECLASSSASVPYWFHPERAGDFNA